MNGSDPRRNDPAMATGRLFLCSGAIGAGLAVVGGALGTHGMGGVEAATLSAFRTAVHYQFLHALALLVIGALEVCFRPARLVRAAGYLMIGGVLLFSGSLYVMTVLEIPVGRATPFGGILLMLGWLLLAVGVVRAPFVPR